MKIGGQRQDCLHLINYLTVLYIFIAACTASLVLVCGLYVCSVTVLRRLRNCRDIIIIIFKCPRE